MSTAATLFKLWYDASLAATRASKPETHSLFAFPRALGGTGVAAAPPAATSEAAAPATMIAKTWRLFIVMTCVPLWAGGGVTMTPSPPPRRLMHHRMRSDRRADRQGNPWDLALTRPQAAAAHRNALDLLRPLRSTCKSGAIRSRARPAEHHAGCPDRSTKVWDANWRSADRSTGRAANLYRTGWIMNVLNVFMGKAHAALILGVVERGVQVGSGRRHDVLRPEAFDFT